MAREHSNSKTMTPVDSKSNLTDLSATLGRYAAQMSSLVKSQFSDMGDCHSASAALRRVLRDDGHHSARLVECCVLSGNNERLTNLCGELGVGVPAGHSVVLVSGYLIDPTAGQFRNETVRIPDYLVLPPDVALSLLQDNRHWLESAGESPRVHRQKSAEHDFQIAYVPTSESFRLPATWPPSPQSEG